jgi:hypothetical protein
MRKVQQPLAVLASEIFLRPLYFPFIFSCDRTRLLCCRWPSRIPQAVLRALPTLPGSEHSAVVTYEAPISLCRRVVVVSALRQCLDIRGFVLEFYLQDDGSIKWWIQFG